MTFSCFLTFSDIFSLWNSTILRTLQSFIVNVYKHSNLFFFIIQFSTFQRCLLFHIVPCWNYSYSYSRNSIVQARQGILVIFWSFCIFFDKQTDRQKNEIRTAFRSTYKPNSNCIVKLFETNTCCLLGL